MLRDLVAGSVEVVGSLRAAAMIKFMLHSHYGSSLPDGVGDIDGSLCAEVVGILRDSASLSKRVYCGRHKRENDVLIEVDVGMGEIARLEVSGVAGVIGLLAALLQRIPIAVSIFHSLHAAIFRNFQKYQFH